MKNNIDNIKNLIEEGLSSILSPLKTTEEQLFLSTSYALKNGKRIRPILLLLTMEALNADINTAITPAICLELIHNYSLIHDDLPCMDDDDYRRGKPSLHKAFPQWLAVLTGDFLLTHSFELLSQSPNLNEKTRLQLMMLFSKNAGSKGILGGQVMDLYYEDKDINWPCLSTIHRKKTAALISTAFEAGAILANTDLKEMEALKKFGNYFGLAYQIIDDYADATINNENKSTNACTLLGQQKTLEKIAYYRNKAKKQLFLFKNETKFLLNYCDRLLDEKLCF